MTKTLHLPTGSHSYTVTPAEFDAYCDRIHTARAIHQAEWVRKVLEGPAVSADLVLRVRDLRPGDVVTPTRFRVSAVCPFGKVARIVGHYPGKDQTQKEWNLSTTVRVERPAPELQIVPSKATLLGHGY